MEIEITVRKDEYGRLYAMDGVCRYNVLLTFCYRQEEKKWYFWPRGNFRPDVFEGGTFPYEYFQDMIRAKFFIRDGGELPDGIVVVKGKYHIRNRK